MKKSFLVGLVLMSCYVLQAQEVTLKTNWTDKNFLTESNALNNLPVTVKMIPLKNGIDVSAVRLMTIRESIVEELTLSGKEKLEEQYALSWSLEKEKRKPMLRVEIIPVRKNGEQVYTLDEFKVQYTGSRVNDNAILQKRGSSSFADNSKLNSGDWYKIKIDQTGIYKITYDQLKEMGIDVNQVNPASINIYGNGIGLLPTQNDVERPDDMVLNRCEFVGGADGVINRNDYILFYGVGPDTWQFSDAKNKFTHTKHLYDTESHYFIGVNTGDPAYRMEVEGESPLSANQIVTEFDDFNLHEIELENLIESGSIWLGDHFGQVESRVFSFSFPNIISTTASVETIVYGRTVGLGQTSSLIIDVNGQSTPYSIQGVKPFNLTSAYAQRVVNTTNIIPNNPVINVTINHNGVGVADEAWLDKIEVNARRSLSMVGSQMSFRDKNSVGAANVAEFRLSSNFANLQVWDVTNPREAKQLVMRSSLGTHQFKYGADSLREFIAHTGASYFSPEFIEQVDNQNLHAHESVNYLIISHPLFLNQANSLAEFHEEKQGLSTRVVNVLEIYNEFSSGTRDVTAIKDYLRMLYTRAQTGDDNELKYVLLFGDGSFDNRSDRADNTNFLPTYQSRESMIATASYVTDDYFVLLDDDEGDGLTEQIDAGIGRFPVQNTEEARQMVDKVKRYMTGSVSGLNTINTGEWKNRICFVADDEDANIHLNQAISLATKVESEHPSYNVFKIYLDAYKQVTTPGGERYYEAQNDLNELVNRGALIINYTGHGGEVGWAEERVLDLTNIKGWNNGAKLPIFMTATCEFTRFDDPGRTSAGEFTLLNPNGGGAALLSTTRVVFSTPNFNLNTEFYNVALYYLDESGDINRLGEVIRVTKNRRAVSGSTNHRNFALFGDPAVPLNFPRHNVVTKKINNQLIGSGVDTLKALSKIVVSGEVQDDQGTVLTDFNGTVVPIVFDKEQTLSTLGNDGDSNKQIFSVQNNIIYKGKVNVVNGLFEYTFVVPKDVGAAYGDARLSYYAWSDVNDATGVETQVTVGGTADSVAIDDIAPEIDVFLNDEQFINGGLTNENPSLIAKMFDENGLNTVGTGIGHDITAILDGDQNNPIVLNDFYEADIDQYKSGKVSYQLNDIEPGPHTLEIKAWDVYNNSAKAKLEFVVANQEELRLDHVLNYPNPFTTQTAFYFEHNQPGDLLKVKLQIFTISGRLVKSFEQFMQTTGSRSMPIAWNGRDDFGDKIARGTYVYKLMVTNSTGKKAEQFQKLVKF